MIDIMYHVNMYYIEKLICGVRGTDNLILLPILSEKKNFNIYNPIIIHLFLV